MNAANREPIAPVYGPDDEDDDDEEELSSTALWHAPPFAALDDLDTDLQSDD